MPLKYSMRTCLMVGLFFLFACSNSDYFKRIKGEKCASSSGLKKHIEVDSLLTYDTIWGKYAIPMVIEDNGCSIFIRRGNKRVSFYSDSVFCNDWILRGGWTKFVPFYSPAVSDSTFYYMKENYHPSPDSFFEANFKTGEVLNGFELPALHDNRGFSYFARGIFNAPNIVVLDSSNVIIPVFSREKQQRFKLFAQLNINTKEHKVLNLTLPKYIKNTYKVAHNWLQFFLISPDELFVGFAHSSKCLIYNIRDETTREIETITEHPKGNLFEAYTKSKDARSKAQKLIRYSGKYHYSLHDKVNHHIIRFYYLPVPEKDLATGLYNLGNRKRVLMQTLDARNLCLIEEQMLPKEVGSFYYANLKKGVVSLYSYPPSHWIGKKADEYIVRIKL